MSCQCYAQTEKPLPVGGAFGHREPFQAGDQLSIAEFPAHLRFTYAMRAVSRIEPFPRCHELIADALFAIHAISLRVHNLGFGNVRHGRFVQSSAALLGNSSADRLYIEIRNSIRRGRRRHSD